MILGDGGQGGGEENMGKLFFATRKKRKKEGQLACWRLDHREQLTSWTCSIWGAGPTTAVRAACPAPQFFSRFKASVQLLVHGVVCCDAHEMAGIFMPVGVAGDRVYMSRGAAEVWRQNPWKVFMGERSGPFSAIGLWRAGAGLGEMHSLMFSSVSRDRSQLASRCYVVEDLR